MGPCASPGCVRRYWVDNESMLSHCVIRMRATAACREHTTHGHRPAITITQPRERVWFTRLSPKVCHQKSVRSAYPSSKSSWKAQLVRIAARPNLPGTVQYSTVQYRAVAHARLRLSRLELIGGSGRTTGRYASAARAFISPTAFEQARGGALVAGGGRVGFAGGGLF